MDLSLVPSGCPTGKKACEKTVQSGVRRCLSYGRDDAAKIILEKALDNSSYWFEQTGTIWEFYHPLGGDPGEVQRKPQTSQNTPCRDYLGQNPLMAMARMYDQITRKHPLYK